MNETDLPAPNALTLAARAILAVIAVALLIGNMSGSFGA